MAGPNQWGYGNLVILDHGGGWYSLYGHLDTISITCGQNVYKGELIGTVGISGNTTKPELHFQVLSGKNFVNPWSILPTPEKCDLVVYNVQEGDTLDMIGKRFNVPVASIYNENNFKLNDILTPGMALTISICHK